MSTKIITVLWGFLTLFWLSNLWSRSFWHQMRTFGWESVPAVVIKSEVKMSSSKNGIYGGIDFRIEGSNPPLEFSDILSERYDFGAKEKAEKFIESHAPGTKHQVYLSKDRREASFGHFPSDYVPWFFLNPIIYGIGFLIGVFRWRKEDREAALASDLRHGSLAEGSVTTSGLPLALDIQSSTLREQYRRMARQLESRQRPYPSDEYATVVALLDCYPRMLADVSHLQNCAECSEITALLCSERLRSGVREFYAAFDPDKLSQTARTMRGHLSQLCGETF